VWKIYKEGQGKWARGLIATAVAVTAVYGVAAIYGALPRPDGTGFDWRLLVGGPLLVAAAAFGVWLFNHPPTANFLIETENELKNKVVWPSKQEEVNASLVVLATVVIFMVFFLGVDFCFNELRELVYSEDSMRKPN
jgi:preprotein translocase SecE subunit